MAQTVPHVAFKVDDLDRAIEGKAVIHGPEYPLEGFRVAFIEDGGAPIGSASSGLDAGGGCAGVAGDTSAAVTTVGDSGRPPVDGLGDLTYSGSYHPSTGSESTVDWFLRESGRADRPVRPRTGRRRLSGRAGDRAAVAGQARADDTHADAIAHADARTDHKPAVYLGLREARGALTRFLKRRYPGSFKWTPHRLFHSSATRLGSTRVRFVVSWNGRGRLYAGSVIVRETMTTAYEFNYRIRRSID